MSTGMSYLNQLIPTINYINKKKIPLALMHCTNLYPTPLEKSRLNSITQMLKIFKKKVWKNCIEIKKMSNLYLMLCLERPTNLWGPRIVQDL